MHGLIVDLLKWRRYPALAAGFMLVAAATGCGPAGSSPGASPSVSPPPPSVSCGHQTIVGSSTPEPSGGPPTESATAEPDAPDAEFPQDEVPEGTWSGPIVASVVGQPTTGSGSVYSAGGGSIQLVIRNHQVVSGTATFNATSSGTVVTASGGQGAISGTLTMTDGVVSGSATALVVTGTAVESGSIVVTVHGVSATTPLTGSVPMTATLVVTKVKCDKVVATFIPDLNSKTGGRSVFTGTAEWRGERQ